MTHPDEQISAKYRKSMNDLAHALDEMFNGTAKGPDRKVMFTLLVGEFHTDGRVNYISNGQRSDIVLMLKELIARFEGQPETKGTA